MAVKLINNSVDLAAMERPWNALAGDMPLRSWDWLATWWKHYGTGDCEKLDSATTQRLQVIAVYDDAERTPQLIGIAPWYLDRTAMKGDVLRWLGSGEVCSDHLSLICRPEHTQQVANEVADALTVACDNWDLLELTDIDAEDAPMAALLAAFDERECLVSRQPADECWILDLPASWEDYLSALSKSHRKQVRQLERRILESERTVWHRVATAEQLVAAWTMLIDLHQRRRRSLGEPGCFASRPFHDFHQDVVGRLRERAQLRMSWLELDGAPAAAEYHFAGGSTTYAYQGGVDPDRLDEEPGRLSTILCIRAAIEEGHQQLDFLRGDEPYKAHWRATPRATFHVRVVPNRRLARLRGRVLNLTGAMTDWIRQSASLLADETARG